MVEDRIVTVWLNYVDQVLIFAVYALSLNLLLGYAGQVSVAHAAFGAVGGYTVVHYTATHGVGYLPALALGVLLAAVVGAILALVSMRLSVEFLVLLTLGSRSGVGGVDRHLPLVGGHVRDHHRRASGLYPGPRTDHGRGLADPTAGGGGHHLRRLLAHW